MTLAVPPLRNHVGVVDAVAAGQSGGHQGHQLVAGVGPAWGAAQIEVPVNQLGQPETPGQGGRKEQPGIGHQAVIIKGGTVSV